MAKQTKESSGIKPQEVQTLIDAEARARHTEEDPTGKVVGHIPVAAALYGPHPDYAEGERETGPPSADVEREQAEERDDDP